MISPGEAIPSFHFTVAQDAVRRIAEVLRDPNPIHFDPAAVHAAGLGDCPINQGPATLAYAVNMMSAAFPDHRIADIRSRYLANVLVGDAIEARGTVESVDGDTIHCRFEVLNGAGQLAVAGVAILVLRGAA